MVLGTRHSIRVFYLLNIVVIIMKAASTSDFDCPTNCECQPESYKVNCSASNITAAIFRQINERTENLDLSRNKFTQLPEALFTYFENIVVLNLAFNEISSIHRYTFIRLGNLKNLDLSNNHIRRLSDISAFIENLNKLQILKLSRNPLIDLGETTDQILYSYSLLHLDVSCCQITHVQGVLLFQGLHSLISLNLSQNPLARIEGFFSDSLESLDVSEIRIQFLYGDTFDKLSRLHELRISNNPRLTDQYTRLSSLSILYIDASYCSIHSNYASDLIEARTVILKGNLIREILANSFENNSKLENLDLSSNRITFVEESAFNGLKSLQYLDLSANFISTIAANTFTFTPHLIYLNLSSNYLRSLEVIKGTSLKHLDLSFCKIRTIASKALLQTPLLRALNVSYNFIEKLPDNFSSDSLQILNAAFCRLTTISASNFCQLSGLREVDLSGNRLVYIKNTTFVKNDLFSLNLENNPWKCDCLDENFVTFWKFLTQHRRIAQKTTLICQYPENVTGWMWENACSTEWSRDVKKRKDVIVLLIVVAVLFVSGIVACIVAIRENWITHHTRIRSNDDFTGTMHAPSSLPENERATTESFRKLTQLPSYDEAILLPRLSLSDSLKTMSMSAQIEKRQSATQTDESLMTLLQETTPKSASYSENTSEEMSVKENKDMNRRSSWAEIEYVNVTSTMVQCTEL